MGIDIVYLEKEMFVSKQTASWRIWQQRFSTFKTSLSFEDAEDLTEFLVLEYKFSDRAVALVLNALNDTNYNGFYLSFITDKDCLTIEKVHLDYFTPL